MALQMVIFMLDDTRLKVRLVRIAVFVVLVIVDGSGPCFWIVAAFAREVDIRNESLDLDQMFQGNIFPEIGVARNDVITVRHTENIPLFRDN